MGGHEGYLTVGLYEDGQPGEIFITMAKEGSTVSGLMDSFATAISLALQYGVPLKVLCDKFSHTRFEPSGWTNNPEIRYAEVGHGLHLPLAGAQVPAQGCAAAGGRQRRHAQRWRCEKAAELASPVLAGGRANMPRSIRTAQSQPGLAGVEHSDDAPSCSDCGAIMVRNGSCYRCMNCGSTSGCS